jgi:hypothetical protein
MPHRPLPALAALLAASALLAADARAAAPAPLDPAAVTRLSNERTLSRWAHPDARARVLAQPVAGAKTVGRLRFDTEDGLSEVYLLLRSYVDPAGRQWIEVRLPARPNGQKGWVPREALGDIRRNTSALRINRRTLRATLTRRGKVVWRARVGVGKPSTPTPAGRFYVRERLIPQRGSIYGALAFGTSAYARVSDWPAAASSASTARTSPSSSRAGHRAAACACGPTTCAASAACCRSARRSTSSDPRPVASGHDRDAGARHPRRAACTWSAAARMRRPTPWSASTG